MISPTLSVCVSLKDENEKSRHYHHHYPNKHSPKKIIKRRSFLICIIIQSNRFRISRKRNIISAFLRDLSAFKKKTKQEINLPSNFLNKCHFNHQSFTSSSIAILRFHFKRVHFCCKMCIWISISNWSADRCTPPTIDVIIRVFKEKIKLDHHQQPRQEEHQPLSLSLCNALSSLKTTSSTHYAII